VFTDLLSFLKFIFRPDKKFVLAIRRITGFFPNRLEYYKTALIHRSRSIKTTGGFYVNNERLEFLGDSVLDLLIGEYLYKKFPNEQEGFLTQCRSRIVNGENLTELTKHIGLDKLVRTNVKKDIHGVHLYGDAFEAFLGAVYLDRGFKKAGKYIIDRIMPKYLNIVELEHHNYNYKSQLIEWSQKHKKTVVFETDLDAPGSKYFISILKVGNREMSSGIGSSKKEAEQKAAHKCLILLGVIRSE
jgi:ribonuclease-3